MNQVSRAGMILACIPRRTRLLLLLAVVWAVYWLGFAYAAPAPQAPADRIQQAPLSDVPASWRAVSAEKPDPAGLILTVTPKVGIAPLAVSITLRLPQPRESDRELELTAWDAGDEEMAAPLFRSTRDVYWKQVRYYREASTRYQLIQIAPGQPDTFHSVPQTLRAHWRLPAGSVLVVGCVWPRSACVAQQVVVS